MRKNTEGQLSALQIAGYSSGNFGKNIVANTLAFFLIFYLTDILGIDPGVAGTLIFISLCFDAVLDPVIGLLSDRTKNRFGKYGAYILLGAPLTALSFVAIFAIPKLFSNPLWVLVGCLLLFRACYTIVDLPHNALISRITTDSRQRATIAVVRFLFSSLSSLCISIASIFLFLESTIANQLQTFTFFSIVAAVLCVACLWTAWLSVQRQDRLYVDEKVNWGSQIKAMRHIYKDRDAVITLAVCFFSALCIPIFPKMMTYFGKYNLGDESSISVGLIATITGQIISTPVWIRLCQKWNKSHALIMAHGLTMFATILFLVQITTPGYWFMVTTFLAGAGFGGIWSIIWSMIPDTVDKLHLKAGVRSEAVFTSFAVVAMKIAQSLGVAILGLLIAASGYMANSVQDDVTLQYLKLMMCLIPFFGSLCCIGLLIFYSLGHQAHAVIAQKLQQRQLF